MIKSPLRLVRISRPSSAWLNVALALVLGLGGELAAQAPKTAPQSGPAMIPMEQIGPQPRSYSDKTPRSVALRFYAHVLHVAPETTPLFAFPEASFSELPLPSSKEYAATRPLCA